MTPTDTQVGDQWGAVLAALKECVSVMAMQEHPRWPDPLYHEEVKALGERIGFGALMGTASAGWREASAEKGYPTGGEFVAGPCFSTLTATLKQARAALDLCAASVSPGTKSEGLSEPKASQHPIRGEGELLPCPFDGEPAVFRAALGEHWVACEHCDATSRMFGSRTLAATEWNRRAHPGPGEVVEPLRPLGQRMRASEDIVRSALMPGDASVFLDGISRHHLQLVLAQAWIDGAVQGRAIERDRAHPPTSYGKGEREAVANAVLSACRQYADTARAYVGERRDVHTGYIVSEATNAILKSLDAHRRKDGDQQ